MFIPGYFQELLNRSEASLHDSLQPTFGSLFSQNAQVFQDLYSDLRHYYRGYKLNLEEALNDFWARLLERLVRELNGRYSMGEDYLDCVAKQAETLRPFGETVREFKLKVTRTFVAARSFVQGLVVAGEVVRKVSQVCRAVPIFFFCFSFSLVSKTIIWLNTCYIGVNVNVRVFQHDLYSLHL